MVYSNGRTVTVFLRLPSSNECESDRARISNQILKYDLFAIFRMGVASLRLINVRGIIFYALHMPLKTDAKLII